MTNRIKFTKIKQAHMRLSAYKIFCIILIFSSTMMQAQTTRKQIEEKIGLLNTMVTKASEANMDVQREKLVIHTAKLFLDFADFDEDNYDLCVERFEMHPEYSTKKGLRQGEKNRAARYAKALPEFQRKETLLMVNDAIATLQKVISGEIVRKPVPKFDWKKLRIEGSSIVNEDGTPIFITDYNFMPRTERFTKYYGNMGNYLINLSLQEDGTLSTKEMDALKDYDSEVATHFGSPLIGHNTPPAWMLALDKENMLVGRRQFIQYDIDNPTVRKYWDEIFSIIVPVNNCGDCKT